ncbi:tripartite tricarboxylate transporter TctB family protein [Pseudorhodoferax sp.]|uniref:tripartite tricarboxylate transporter TctB family protein n=1 Tax=Pseudorhodoferax sp. TaxID=1993553 RepID=UPI0039E5B0A0
MAGARNTPQALVSLAVLATGLAMGWGALDIPSAAGYGGVGPNFLPLLCAGALVLCGVLLLREACTGGYREMDPPDGVPPNRGSFVWVSAGLLLNAALIERVGFVLGCALCYLLAVQGLRRAAGQPIAGRPRTWALDLLTGLAIAAPVYWMFTQFLAINLPGLTGTGWL